MASHPVKIPDIEEFDDEAGICIKDIPTSVKELDIRTYLQTFGGVIRKFHLIRNKKSKRVESCLVFFDSPETVRRIVSATPFHIISHCFVRINQADRTKTILIRVPVTIPPEEESEIMSLLKRSQNNEDIVSIDHTFETRTKEWLACYKTRRDSVIARKKIAQYRHRHGRRLWEILYPNIGCFNNVLHIQFNPPSIQKRPITLQNLTAFYYSILGFFSRYECSEVEIHVHRTEFKGYGRILFKESLNGGRLADHCLSEVNKLIPQVTFPITVGEGPTQLTLNLSFTLSINKPRITPQPPTNRSILPLPPIKATDHMRPQPAVSFAIPQPVPQISQSTPIRSSQRHQSHHRRAKSMPDLTHGPEQESENEIDKEDDQDSGFSESIHESILDDGSTPEKSSFVYTSDDSPPKDASSSDTIL